MGHAAKFMRNGVFVKSAQSTKCKHSEVSQIDIDYMQAALALAKLAGSDASPNPQVGCVVVREGSILGFGYHQRSGWPHAEREALACARERGIDVRGACAYVTLEPCNHTGKTPPCTNALIDAGVARVVIGGADPNPLVAGAGVLRLRSAGIDVVELYKLKEDHRITALCKQLNNLNHGFFSRITRGLPYVVAKYAMTLDGKIATYTGASKWITGEVARRRVYVERARTDAVVTGVGTVLADNPSFTSRIDEFSRSLLLNEDDMRALAAVGLDSKTCIDTQKANTPQPIRVVCDTNLRMPKDCALVRSAGDMYSGYKLRTIIATCINDSAKTESYKKLGCEVWQIDKNSAGHVDLKQLLNHLADEGINNVTLEGGSAFLGGAFDAGVVDAVEAYIAPKIFGGEGAPSPVAGIGVASPTDAPRLKNIKIENLNSDYLISGEVF
jgi:diaminohydroxyphosphoribosylaminopyrimidine deaminase/5-amino-6-(5-phosphoribosylamino)uracil reductase